MIFTCPPPHLSQSNFVLTSVRIKVLSKSNCKDSVKNNTLKNTYMNQPIRRRSSYYMQSFVGRTSVLTPITFPVPGLDPASHVITAHQENKAIFWLHTQRWPSKVSIHYHQPMGPTTLDFVDTRQPFPWIPTHTCTRQLFLLLLLSSFFW